MAVQHKSRALRPAAWAAVGQSNLAGLPRLANAVMGSLTERPQLDAVRRAQSLPLSRCISGLGARLTDPFMLDVTLTAGVKPQEPPCSPRPLSL
jgi:hypothetical protein